MIVRYLCVILVVLLKNSYVFQLYMCYIGFVKTIMVVSYLCVLLFLLKSYLLFLLYMCYIGVLLKKKKLLCAFSSLCVISVLCVETRLSFSSSLCVILGFVETENYYVLPALYVF